jgi:hypothetical protein
MSYWSNALPVCSGPADDGSRSDRGVELEGKRIITRLSGLGVIQKIECCCSCCTNIPKNKNNFCVRTRTQTLIFPIAFFSYWHSAIPLSLLSVARYRAIFTTIVELCTEHIEFAQSIMIVPFHLRSHESRDVKSINFRFLNSRIAQ